MAKSSKRILQTADLIQRELAQIIRREISDPRLTQLTITGVDVAPDLGSARVYYTVYDKEQLPEVKKALTKALGYMRHQLSVVTALRHTPQLHFVYDESILYGEHLGKLIEDAK